MPFEDEVLQRCGRSWIESKELIHYVTGQIYCSAEISAINGVMMSGFVRDLYSNAGHYSCRRIINASSTLQQIVSRFLHSR